MVVVHVDGDGNLVITQNPTISSIPTKSGYEPKVKESDGTVDAATTEEVTEFLETFFKLYPTATEKELAYYVSGNVLEPVKLRLCVLGAGKSYLCQRWGTGESIGIGEISRPEDKGNTDFTV